MIAHSFALSLSLGWTDVLFKTIFIYNYNYRDWQDLTNFLLAVDYIKVPRVCREFLREQVPLQSPTWYLFSGGRLTEDTKWFQSLQRVIVTLELASHTQEGLDQNQLKVFPEIRADCKKSSKKINKGLFLSKYAVIRQGLWGSES